MRELDLRNLSAVKQQQVRIEYKGLVFEESLKFDVLVSPDPSRFQHEVGNRTEGNEGNEGIRGARDSISGILTTNVVPTFGALATSSLVRKPLDSGNRSSWASEGKNTACAFAILTSVR